MNKMLDKIVLLVGILVFSLGQIAVAQEKEVPVYNLREIVVTGTKIEKKAQDLPFSASLITAEEISQKPTLTIDHIVRSVSGVHSIRPHPATYGVFVTMRGHALTKQVIALDGQPINDGFNGYVRYSVIPSAIWERVEIIRGPYSALFGPYAMGGAINFVPKTSLKENELKMQMGSFGTRSASLLYGVTIKDRLNLVIFADEKDIEGYVGDFVVMEPRTTQPTGTITDVTGFEKTYTPQGKIAYKIGDRGAQYSKDHRNLYLGLSYKVTPKSELSLNYLYGRQRHGFAGEKTYLKDTAGRPVNSGNVRFIDDGTTYYLTIAPFNFLDMEGVCGQDVFNVKYKNEIRENISLTVFGGLNTRVQKWSAPLSGATSSGGPGRKGTPEGLSTRVGVEAKIIPFAKNTLVPGAELILNSGSAKRERLSDWKNIDSVTTLEEDVRGKHQIASVYFVDEFAPFDKLSIWLGGRYDNWKKYDGEMITPTKTTTFADETVSRFSPKLGILVKPYDFLGIKTSYGEGFRVPSIHELYRQVITPTSVSLANPELKPEINKCVEIGVEIYPSVLYSKVPINTVKLNCFIDETKDLIYIKKWREPHPDTGVEVDFLQRQNAGKAKTEGLEIELEGATIRLPYNVNFSWFGNLSLYNPRITENPAAPETVGKVITYVPQEMYNAGFNLVKEPIFITLSMHKRGKVYLMDDNSDAVNNVVGSMDPFTVFDVTVGYKIAKNATFSIAVTNLFDEKYYSMHNQLAPGRSIAGELNLKF